MGRAQAALEFLTTYGWAFILIIIVIASFGYLGITDTEDLVPESCTSVPGIGCSEMTAQETSEGSLEVFFVLKNSLNSPLMLQNELKTDVNVFHKDKCQPEGGMFAMKKDSSDSFVVEYSFVENSEDANNRAYVWGVDEELTFMQSFSNCTQQNIHQINFDFIYKKARSSFEKILSGEGLAKLVKTPKVYYFAASPLLADDAVDSDGDGWSDDDEDLLGTDKNDENDVPTSSQSPSGYAGEIIFSFPVTKDQYYRVEYSPDGSEWYDLFGDVITPSTPYSIAAITEVLEYRVPFSSGEEYRIAYNGFATYDLTRIDLFAFKNYWFLADQPITLKDLDDGHIDSTDMYQSKTFDYHEDSYAGTSSAELISGDKYTLSLHASAIVSFTIIGSSQTNVVQIWFSGDDILFGDIDSSWFCDDSFVAVDQTVTCFGPTGNTIELTNTVTPFELKVSAENYETIHVESLSSGNVQWDVIPGHEYYFTLGFSTNLQLAIFNHPDGVISEVWLGGSDAIVTLMNYDWVDCAPALVSYPDSSYCYNDLGEEIVITKTDVLDEIYVTSRTASVSIYVGSITVYGWDNKPSFATDEADVILERYDGKWRYADECATCVGKPSSSTVLPPYVLIKTASKAGYVEVPPTFNFVSETAHANPATPYE